MNYKAIENSQSVIRHYGKKGMKWGVRIKSAIDRGNARAMNSTKGLQKDYLMQRKYNKAEWKAVQKHTRNGMFSPLTNDVLRRQQAEYAKLKSYKDEMKSIDFVRKESKNPNDRKYVKKEHLAEYDKLNKTLSKRRPHYDGPELRRWDKAYDRQVELTNIGLDHRYAKASKAYNDYLKGT